MPEKSDYFSSNAIKNGYDPIFLEKSGLSIFKNEKPFDRFRGRIMFPIHSMSGRVLGFGGRILNQSIKDSQISKFPRKFNL